MFLFAGLLFLITPFVMAHSDGARNWMDYVVWQNNLPMMMKRMIAVSQRFGFIILIIGIITGY